MDELDSLKAKKKKAEEKIAALEAEIAKVQVKIGEIDKEIFRREDGRFLTAAKEAAKINPEFAKVVSALMEEMAIKGATKKPAAPKPAGAKQAKATA